MKYALKDLLDHLDRITTRVPNSAKLTCWERFLNTRKVDDLMPFYDAGMVVDDAYHHDMDKERSFSRMFRDSDIPLDHFVDPIRTRIRDIQGGVNSDVAAGPRS
jgi:hypothetical protein